MMAAQRKSELTAEEIQKLKEEMERERRETMAEMQMYNKKIKEMQNEANAYRDKLKGGQGDLEKAKQYAKQLQQQSKNL